MTSGSLPAMDIDWLAVVRPSTMWTSTSTAASATSTIAASPATSLRTTCTHPPSAIRPFDAWRLLTGSPAGKRCVRIARPEYTPGALRPAGTAIGRLAVGTVLSRFALRDDGATNQ